VPVAPPEAEPVTLATEDPAPDPDLAEPEGAVGLDLVMEPPLAPVAVAVAVSRPAQPDVRRSTPTPGGQTMGRQVL
jgi:hypothetical protein